MDAAGITRIVHLSDAHVLDPRPSRTRSGWSMQVRFLSIGRPLDAEGRRKKLARSLAAARRLRANHVVLSGDLTEIGSPGEYETLAEILHDSGIAPEQMTLVPGNHDMYSSPDGWRWALGGPLSAFARTSATRPRQDGGNRRSHAASARCDVPPARHAFGRMYQRCRARGARSARERPGVRRPSPHCRSAPSALRAKDAGLALDGRSRRGSEPDVSARKVPAPFRVARPLARHGQPGARLRRRPYSGRNGGGRRQGRSSRPGL
jgi:hypothetical protein